jgi:hypothetical protein
MDDDRRAEAAAVAGLLRASLARVQHLRHSLAEAMARDAAIRREVEAVACTVLARFYALERLHFSRASRRPSG